MTTTTTNTTHSNIKIQHYFNYSTILKDKEACSCFLDYLTQVTHCDENLLFLLHLDQVKSIKNIQTTMEQVQLIIDTYVKLDSPKELNINEKIRSSVMEHYEELKRYVTNHLMVVCEGPALSSSTTNNTSSTNTFENASIDQLQQRIQQVFHELSLQINLQLKQDSFESYLSSEYFERFIVKKVKERYQILLTNQNEKQRKKRSSYFNSGTGSVVIDHLAPGANGDNSDSSPIVTTHDLQGRRESDATMTPTEFSDSWDSSSENVSQSSNKNLMKRFVGGLLKQVDLEPENIKHRVKAEKTDTSLGPLAGVNGSGGETIDIMKNIIQDLYKQLIQKDQEIKRLQQVLKQSQPLERKAKPLPTTPGGTHLSDSPNTSPRGDSNTSPITTPSTPPIHSKTMSVPPLNTVGLNGSTSNNTITNGNNRNNIRPIPPVKRQSLTSEQVQALKQMDTLLPPKSPTPSSQVETMNNPTSEEDTPILRRQSTQLFTANRVLSRVNAQNNQQPSNPTTTSPIPSALPIGNKKETATPPELSKQRNVLEIRSSQQSVTTTNEEATTPRLNQRLQFFEKLSNSIANNTNGTTVSATPNKSATTVGTSTVTPSNNANRRTFAFGTSPQPIVNKD